MLDRRHVCSQCNERYCRFLSPGCVMRCEEDARVTNMNEMHAEMVGSADPRGEPVL